MMGNIFQDMLLNEKMKLQTSVCILCSVRKWEIHILNIHKIFLEDNNGWFHQEKLAD